jgi:hypothetical protein
MIESEAAFEFRNLELRAIPPGLEAPLQWRFRCRSPFAAQDELKLGLFERGNFLRCCRWGLRPHLLKEQR